LQWDSVIFDSIHQVFIVVNDYEITIVDSTFNDVLRKKLIIVPEIEEEFFCHLHQSKNGQHIIITYSNKIIIMRYEDLEIVLVEHIPYACFAEFSDDNQYLLVGTWENGYVLENNLY
jgi:hypothetical protein